MALQRKLVCVIFAVVVVCIVSETTDEKTTEAVLKAVVQAENAPKARPRNGKEAEDAKNAEEASAVAKATSEVLDTESVVDAVVSENVLETATANAKKTFKELAEDGVAPKAAADAAAKVAVETVDGASDLTLRHGVKVNAEKAAIAAAQAVADHPNSQGEAVTEAISTIKKEERTPGKALQKDKAKGIVARAKDAVKDLPKMAQDGADTAADKLSNLGSASLFLPLAALAMILIGIGVKNFEALANNTPYLKRLRAIREEFHGDGTPADYEKGFIETGYADYSEMEPMTVR
jgi:hypothetical protein